MNHITPQTLDPDHRVLRGEFNGASVWCKYAVPEKTPLCARIQRVVAPFMGAAILRPSYIADRHHALAFEAERLRTLGEKGFRVPRVLHHARDHIIMTDAGACLKSVVEGEPSPDMRRTLLAEAARALGVLHAYGEYHGRPKLQDLTIRGSSIGFIDLEQDALAVMPLADAQVRDALLFMLDAAPHLIGSPGAMDHVVQAYVRAIPVGLAERADDIFAGPLGMLGRVARPVLGKSFVSVNAALRRAIAARLHPAARGATGTKAHPA